MEEWQATVSKVELKAWKEATAKEPATGNHDFKHVAARAVLKVGKNPRLFRPCFVLVKTKNE